MEESKCIQLLDGMPDQDAKTHHGAIHKLDLPM